MNWRAIIFCIVGLSVGACETVGEHAAAVRKAEGESEKVTVGTVQREIKVGMSGADVIKVLGSPNVITTDEQRREVWVYDKISSTSIRSESSSSASILIIGGRNFAGASSTSQRTLTVIIKFDDEKKVRDFAYHTSRF